MKVGKIQPDVAAVNQPRTLFKPGSWVSKIDFINHLILFNNVLITVLSEKEGGKTSFSTLLQNNLDQQIKSISMTVTPPCNIEEIINDIASQLHLNNDSQTNIASIVAQINERKAHVLLVIDDAQHLPEPFIKEVMLAIKGQEDFGFFHLCLVSDYSVVAALNTLAVDQFNNLIHTIELGALNESETRTYVLQRAMNAHLINRPLSDLQYKQFYQLTKGNLAKINSSLESFIFKCTTKKKSNPMLTLKKTSIAVIAAVTVGFSFMYFDIIDNKYSISNLTTTLNSVIPTRTSDKLSDKPAFANKEQFASQIASWQDSSTRQFVHNALPKKQILDDFEDGEQNINTVALVDKVLVIPKVKISTELFSPAPDQVALESKLVPIKENNPMQFAKLEKNPLIQEKINIQNNIIAQKKVVAQKKSAAQSNTKRYTIQLVASHKINDVHRFRKNNNLVAKTVVRHFTNTKGTWYILTLGEYESRNKAFLKTKKLPAELAKLNPWIRPVSGLTNVG